MHPGKPQGFGVVGRSRTPIVMLPANPVSALVSFWLFAVPVARARQGRGQEQQRTSRAVLTGAVRVAGGQKVVHQRHL